MRRTPFILWTFLLAATVVQAGTIQASEPAAAVELLVAPDVLHITESFNGSQVTVSADIPRGADAVVEVRGAAKENHLLRKGRRGGLWMSVGEVKVLGLPSLYLVMSTPGLSLDKGNEKKLGYAAIESQAKFNGDLPKGGKAALLQQFLNLKESEGLYGLFPGALKVKETQDDQAKITGQLRLPSNISVGDYQIVLSVFKNGRLLQQKSTQLKVDVKGVTAFLLSLAHGHGVLYGLLAVVVAFAAGFVMGIVFKGKSAH